MIMKKFLIQFGIWIGIALALSFPIDAMISSGLRKTDIRKYAVWNDIYKGGLHPDLVVVGSSRAWCGYNTFILDSILNCDSYNLGLDGHCIDFQIIRYDTYCRFNRKPKVVLLNTEFLSTLGITAESPYEREQFFPYIQDKELISRVAKAKRITWIDEYLPLVRYFGYREEFENGIKAFFGKKFFFDGGMHKGYRGKKRGWDRASLSKDTVFFITIEKEPIVLLDSFSKRLIDDGIKVVYVKSPIYFPLRSKFANIEQTDSIFDSISRKYNIPILDYYFSDISMDSVYFYNPSHLNKMGSELFTMELCKDLDSLGIIHR
jgi:hypothetical protein